MSRADRIVRPRVPVVLVGAIVERLRISRSHRTYRQRYGNPESFP